MIVNQFPGRLNSSVRSPLQPALAGAVELSEYATDANNRIDELVCEFHWSALKVGAITSCMNAVLKTGHMWMLRSCNNVMPTQPPEAAALRNLERIALSQKLVSLLRKIYDDLAREGTLALPVFGRAGVLGMPVITLAELKARRDSWRLLAANCREAIEELDVEITARWPSSAGYKDNSPILRALLTEAVRGQNSCLSPFGELSLPALPQRRTAERRAFRQVCRIFCHGRFWRATTYDISRTGIGLHSEHTLAVNDELSIEIADKRRIEGRVAWSSGRTMGIRFDRPLTVNDPLLIAG